MKLITAHQHSGYRTAARLCGAVTSPTAWRFLESTQIYVLTRAITAKGWVLAAAEDEIMFRAFLNGNYKIRYRPDMAILHLVDGWKLKRNYFLKLHYRAGLRAGRHELPNYSRTLFGIPPFLVTHCMRQSLKALGMFISGKTGALRQGMNAAHAIGSLIGYGARKSP